MKLFKLSAFLMLAICFVTFNATAQDKQSGLQFSEATWDEVRTEARETGKPIFVDAFATWCGPCKKMARDVFPQKAVGKFMNENYLSLKLDMEKGEGLEFASTYSVTAYPTLLFFDSDGALQHRVTGYLEVDEFLEDAKTATDPTKALIGLKNKYDNGKRDKATVMNYAFALRKANMPFTDVTKEYISKLKSEDLNDKSIQQFILAFADIVNSKSFKLLTENKNKFVNSFGEEKVNEVINRSAIRSVSLAASNEQGITMPQIKKVLKAHGGDKAKNLTNYAYMGYNQMQQNWNAYAKYANKYITTLSERNSSTLNNVAWAFFENVDNPKMLAKAVGWAKESVDLDCQYYNCDTYAALLYKIKDYNNAKMAAEKAIEQAKAGGDGYDETQNLLNKINAAIDKM